MGAQGTRSVSTLTPTQLARKRANDREAQRAIRARTKEHIERLERELEDLKSRPSRDETIQDLKKANQYLEATLAKLREEFRKIGGVPPPAPYAPPYATPGAHGSKRTGTKHRSTEADWSAAYEESMPGSPSGVSSQDFHHSPLREYGQPYIPAPEESWGVGAVMPVSVSSSVSSPSSTAANEEYSYQLPTRVAQPSDGSGFPPASVPLVKHRQMEYDDLERG